MPDSRKAYNAVPVKLVNPPETIDFFNLYEVLPESG